MATSATATVRQDAVDGDGLDDLGFMEVRSFRNDPVVGGEWKVQSGYKQWLVLVDDGYDMLVLAITNGYDML